MENTKFLETYQLERSLPTKEANAFEKLLKVANESFVIIWKKEKGVRANGLQYWNFQVHSPVTNFADAYALIGMLWAKYVLPIWHKRQKQLKQKKS